MDKQQTPVTDPAPGGDKDAKGPNPSEPSKPSANADVHAVTPEQSLAMFKELTGRDFATLEDAKKHYEGLNSLVGDNAIADTRKRATLVENLAKKIAAENSWSLDAAYAFIESINAEGKSPAGIGAPDKSFDPKQAETDARVRRMERELFLTKHPEAQAVMSQLDDYTNATGKSIEEAFSTLYGGVMETFRDEVRSDALRSEKKGATVPASSSAPVPPEPDLYAENMKMYQKTGKKEYFHEAIKRKWDKNPGLINKVGA